MKRILRGNPQSRFNDSALESTIEDEKPFKRRGLFGLRSRKARYSESMPASSMPETIPEEVEEPETPPDTLSFDESFVGGLNRIFDTLSREIKLSITSTDDVRDEEPSTRTQTESESRGVPVPPPRTKDEYFPAPRAPGMSIWNACKVGSKAAVVNSIAHDPSIVHKIRKGRTPLHHACYNGHANITRLLLENGATDKDGKAYRLALNEECRVVLREFQQQSSNKAAALDTPLNPSKNSRVPSQAFDVYTSTRSWQEDNKKAKVDIHRSKDNDIPTQQGKINMAEDGLTISLSQRFRQMVGQSDDDVSPAAAEEPTTTYPKTGSSPRKLTEPQKRGRSRRRSEDSPKNRSKSLKNRAKGVIDSMRRRRRAKSWDREGSDVFMPKSTVGKGARVTKSGDEMKANQSSQRDEKKTSTPEPTQSSENAKPVAGWALPFFLNGVGSNEETDEETRQLKTDEEKDQSPEKKRDNSLEAPTQESDQPVTQLEKSNDEEEADMKRNTAYHSSQTSWFSNLFPEKMRSGDEQEVDGDNEGSLPEGQAQNAVETDIQDLSSSRHTNETTHSRNTTETTISKSTSQTAIRTTTSQLSRQTPTLNQQPSQASQRTEDTKKGRKLGFRRFRRKSEAGSSSSPILSFDLAGDPKPTLSSLSQGRDAASVVLEPRKRASTEPKVIMALEPKALRTESRTTATESNSEAKNLRGLPTRNVDTGRCIRPSKFKGIRSRAPPKNDLTAVDSYGFPMTKSPNVIIKNSTADEGIEALCKTLSNEKVADKSQKLSPKTLFRKSGRRFPKTPRATKFRITGVEPSPDPKLARVTSVEKALEEEAPAQQEPITFGSTSNDYSSDSSAYYSESSSTTSSGSSSDGEDGSSLSEVGGVWSLDVTPQSSKVEITNMSTILTLASSNDTSDAHESFQELEQECCYACGCWDPPQEQGRDDGSVVAI